MTEEALEQKIEVPEMSSAEETARKSGWKPESEFEGEDSKPATFISAELFNERGVWIERHKSQEKRINDLETNFNSRLDNTNKLHQQQMEAQKSELVRKRDDAIDLADRETANRIQGDIDKLNTPAESAPVNNDQSTLDAWNQANPWIFQSGPRSAYAHAQLRVYESQGMKVSAALASVDADIAREYPAVNESRSNHPSSEGGSSPGGKRQARALTMADLTAEESNIYKKTPGTWDNEAQFLKAVQDSRGEA